jgi:HlyD family secretion protein
MLAVVGLAALGLAASRMTRAREIDAIAVRRQPMIQTVVASGRVLPPARIDLGTTLLGIVMQVNAEEGQHVAAGAVLVTLDDAELRAAVVASEAALEQARLEVELLRRSGSPSAREGLVQARLDLDLAQQRAERLMRLSQAGAVTATDVDEARSAREVAQSRVRQAELTARERGNAGSEHRANLAALDQAQANLAAAQARLARTRVSAPADSVVLQRQVEPGDVVQPGQVLVVLAREGQKRISVPIDERNIARLALKQRARVIAEAFPERPFDAEVDFIAPAVEPDRGTVEVRLGVLAPPVDLRADMTVTAEIEVSRRESVLAVPVGALVSGPDGGPAVWTAVDGVAVARPVVLGGRGSALVEILSGLNEGEIVLLAQTGEIEAGQRVRPRLRPPRP